MEPQKILTEPSYLIVIGPPYAGKSLVVDYCCKQGLSRGSFQNMDEAQGNHAVIDGLVHPSLLNPFYEQFCVDKAHPKIVLIDAPVQMRRKRAASKGLESYFDAAEEEYRHHFPDDLSLQEFTIQNTKCIHHLYQNTYSLISFLEMI